MKNVASVLLILLFITACNPEKKRRPVLDDAGNKIAQEKDSTSFLMAGLPIHIDSTEFLVHPVGKVQFYESSKFYGRSSGGWEMGRFFVTNYTNYTFTGDLHNLQFEKIGSNTLRPLTLKKLKISSAQFLYETYKNTGKQLFIYEIIDEDSNADGLLDYKDLKSLYISHIDGSNFKKLNANGHDIIDFKIMNSVHRFYFRSITDSNKDGKFDKNDSIHYQYLDLQDPDLKVKAYFPEN